ncbi:MAG: aminotransferase class I/II-fold pyridoxal phosphate-dependent enzyme, partial [Methanobacterium sp.]
EAIIFDPAWVSYDPCVKLAGARTIWAPTQRDNGFTPVDVEEYITEKTKLIVINSPCNPTGGVYGKETLKEIADIAIDKNIFVLSDEIYEKIIYDGKHYSPGRYTDNAITINGFSKTYAMTGFRIGYVAAIPEIIEEMLKVHQYNAVCASSLSQIAGLEALIGPQECVGEMVDEFKRRRDLVVNRLNEMGISLKAPKGAYYVFPKVPNSVEFINEAVKKGVITVNGAGFGKCGEGHFRISYAAAYDKLAEAMDRLENIKIN